MLRLRSAAKIIEPATSWVRSRAASGGERQGWCPTARARPRRDTAGHVAGGTHLEHQRCRCEARRGRTARPGRRLSRPAGSARGFQLRRAPQGLERVDRSVPGADRAVRRRRGRDRSSRVREEQRAPASPSEAEVTASPACPSATAAIVIDLGPMKGIRVDPEARTARAQAGVLWGELDRETQAFGLATTGGIVTHTGVAGLTLGGGIGWLQRKHGLTIDQLLSVDLVTADGELGEGELETENPDLFWGLRGGGGNFGIVTEFEFRLHPVGPIVLAGPIFWPIEKAPALLRFYREWSAEAPDELMTIVVQRKAPSLPFVPSRASRQAGRERRVLLRGTRRGGGGGGASAQAVRRAGARSLPAQALRRLIRRCSTHPSRTTAGTTCEPATWRAERRGDRHRGRPSRGYPLTAHGLPDLAARRSSGARG